MVGVTIQQQSKWYLSGRDGSRQNHSDDCIGHLSHGEEESQWSIPHHRTVEVSMSAHKLHLNVYGYTMISSK